jgi:hypothetical protein
MSIWSITLFSGAIFGIGLANADSLWGKLFPANTHTSKQYFDLGYKQVLSSNITSLGSGFHLEVGGNPGYWISDELGLYLFIGGSVLWFHDYNLDFKRFLSTNSRIPARMKELMDKRTAFLVPLTQEEQGELDDYALAQKEFESIATGKAELGYMGYFGVLLSTGIRYLPPVKIYRFWLSTTSGSKFNGLYRYSDGTVGGEPKNVGVIDRWGWGLETIVLPPLINDGYSRGGLGAISLFAEISDFGNTLLIGEDGEGFGRNKQKKKLAEFLGPASLEDQFGLEYRIGIKIGFLWE